MRVKQKIALSGFQNLRAEMTGVCSKQLTPATSRSSQESVVATVSVQSRMSDSVPTQSTFVR